MCDRTDEQSTYIKRIHAKVSRRSMNALCDKGIRRRYQSDGEYINPLETEDCRPMKLPICSGRALF